MTDQRVTSNYTAIILMANTCRGFVVEHILQEVKQITRHSNNAEYLYRKELDHIHFLLQQLRLHDEDIAVALEQLKQRVQQSCEVGYYDN